MNKLQLQRDELAKAETLKQQLILKATVGGVPGAGPLGTGTPYFTVDPDGRVYNGLSYTRTNSLPNNLPMMPLRVYGVKATSTGDIDVPDTVAAVRAMPEGCAVVLDAEEWMPQLSQDGEDLAKAKLWALMELCQRVHEVRPLSRYWGFGLYGLGGCGGMHPDNPAAQTDAWYKDQMFYATPLGRFSRGVMGQVSWLTPSIYPCFTDLSTWKKWFNVKMRACRQLQNAAGRKTPIVPFLTYRWHANTGKETANRLVPGEFFRAMLMHTLDYADGGILWDWDGYGTDGNYANDKIGHGTSPLMWSDTASWYLATRSIMRACMVQKPQQLLLVDLDGGE